MADLKALLVAEGYPNVATLLQSGNLVLGSPILAAGVRSTGPRIVSTTGNWNTIGKLAALL